MHMRALSGMVRERFNSEIAVHWAGAIAHMHPLANNHAAASNRRAASAEHGACWEGRFLEECAAYSDRCR